MKIEVKDIMNNITEIINKMHKEMHMISVFQGIEYSQIQTVMSIENLSAR